MSNTVLTRSDLAKITGGNHKLTVGLESIINQSNQTAAVVGTTTEATTGIQNATVIVLSPNDVFTQERVLEVDGNSMSISDTGSAVIIGLLYPITIQGGFRLQFDLSADTELVLPGSGTVQTTDYQYPGPFASDAAAATGGVAVNGIYLKTGGTVVWRQT